MSYKYIVAVDAMGGDNAPLEIVKGSVLAISENSDIKIILVGIKEKIEECLSLINFKNYERLEIVNATSVIETNETPTTAIKEKKDSSMVVGLNLLKENKASAFVSAGNTGALLTGSTLIVGRIRGVLRPCLATLLPTSAGFVFLGDVGANVDSKPEYLLQFAKMGSVYMENVLKTENPKVGLINIGEEREKGNSLTKEAYGLLEGSNVNFCGNIEARDISAGKADVVVCDGFVGNIILKHTEGLAYTLMGIIKKELMATTKSKIGALLAKGAFKNIKKRFDYKEIGGAPFLGLKQLVIKAHGSSDERAIKSAINQAYIFISNDITNKIKKKLGVSNEK